MKFGAAIRCRHTTIATAKLPSGIELPLEAMCHTPQTIATIPHHCHTITVLIQTPHNKANVRNEIASEKNAPQVQTLIYVSRHYRTCAAVSHHAKTTTRDGTISKKNEYNMPQTLTSVHVPM